MKLETFKYPESSFLSMDKDLSILVDLCMQNNNLKKLLYYTTKDCLNQQALTEDESLSLLNKNIKLIPKLSIDKSVLNYIIISFDGFSTNATNPEFRDNLIEFDIICHFDQWQLSDFQLRPYRIAAEIDSMLNNKRLTNIGKLEFVGANQLILNDEFAGLCLMYQAIHGEEDKKHPLNPNDEQRLNLNFDEIFNK